MCLRVCIQKGDWEGFSTQSCQPLTSRNFQFRSPERETTWSIWRCYVSTTYLLENLRKALSRRKKLTNDSYGAGIQSFLLKFPTFKSKIHFAIHIPYFQYFHSTWSRKKIYVYILQKFFKRNLVYWLTQPLYALSLRYLSILLRLDVHGKDRLGFKEGLIMTHFFHFHYMFTTPLLLRSLILAHSTMQDFIGF